MTSTLLRLALLALLAPRVTPAQEPAVTLAPEAPLAALRSFEIDPRPGRELVLVERGGVVQVLGYDGASAGFAPIPGGRITLAAPRASLLALSPSWQGGGPALCVLSPEGFRVHEWIAGSGFAGEGELYSPRARFELALDRPSFAPILADLDRDGREELLVPAADTCAIWRLQPEPERARPRLVRMAEVTLKSEHQEGVELEHLSDRLRSAWSIPFLGLRDVNGDGRDDLVVEAGQSRAYHLQREDGSYPREADSGLDLSLFRDAEREGGLAPGEVLSGGDQRAQLVSEDLDGDGVLDHVITQGRKVWIFRGTREGPRFDEPVRILKASEDVTAALVLDVDRDGLADLVLLKVRVPELAGLVLGLLSDWEVGAHVVGYKNKGGLELDMRATFERDLTLVLPPLLDVLRSPDKWVRRFERLSEDLAPPLPVTLGKEGTAGLFLARPGEGSLALWRAHPSDPPPPEAGDGRDFLRNLLFDDPRLRWSLEDLVQSLADGASAGWKAWIRGREPERRFTLRPREQYLYLGMVWADYDGDGAGELAVGYERKDRPGELVLDLLRP